MPALPGKKFHNESSNVGINRTQERGEQEQRTGWTLGPAQLGSGLGSATPQALPWGKSLTGDHFLGKAAITWAQLEPKLG